MPFKSLKQERWGHTEAGEKALGGSKKVNEWDQASKGLKLPELKPMADPITTNTKHGYAKKGQPFTI
jgi:hypothetical protein